MTFWDPYLHEIAPNLKRAMGRTRIERGMQLEKNPGHISVLCTLYPQFPPDPESLSLASNLRLFCMRLYDWDPFKTHSPYYLL